MGRAVDSLLRRLTRTGFRRGLRGDHWAWFVVAAASYVLSRAARGATDAARLDLGDLEPGQGYEVRLVRPDRPRAVRRARRGERRAADRHA